jgi:hypothetical protein
MEMAGLQSRPFLFQEISAKRFAAALRPRATSLSLASTAPMNARSAALSAKNRLGTAHAA